MPSRLRLIACSVAVTGLALVAAACGDTTGLPRAVLPNGVDTVSLYALYGTPISAPSAYLLDGRQRLRTDESTGFDFVFNFDSLGRAVLLPTGAVGLVQASGLQRATVPFDSVKVAPTDGYRFAEPLVVDSGTVAIVRSRPTECGFGFIVPLYAKLEVLVIDRTATARRLGFRILVDENCGYRGLEPGLPQQ
jgi:hypothetical protein